MTARARKQEGRPTLPWGYNVIGYVSGNLGLGVAARNTVSCLLGRGEQLRTIDLDPGESRFGFDKTYADLRASPGSHPLAVNLFHLNPEEIPPHAPAWMDDVRLNQAINACVPFWELPYLPPAWVPILDAMDVVLAPSRFVMQACYDAGLHAEILHYPQYVKLPSDVAAARDRWHIGENTISFLMLFDPFSDIERKNPWGTISAFRSAFRGDDDVVLIIKANCPTTDEKHPENDRLVKAAAEDPRIRVVFDRLSYSDVLSLYASCDVFVSLHRAEGLGLPIVEAMSLGKPVITTGWSGNMDFTNASNSVLVPFDLVPVVSSNPAYLPKHTGSDQHWAAPDLEAAARAMRTLADDAEWRAHLSGASRADARRRNQHARRGDVFGTIKSMSHDLVGNTLRNWVKTRVLRT
jgi:glycosyltransferase involved in cell wall biosynthesis